jgi:hypothetical protein
MKRPNRRQGDLMTEGIRNACISATIIRVRHKGFELDKAIQESVSIYCPSEADREHTQLRSDVEAALAGRWPKKMKQLELAI